MIKKRLPLLANIAAQLIFGLGYIFTQMGMRVIDQNSVKLLAFRFCIAALALTLLVVTGIKKVNYRTGPVALILLCGLLNPLISQVLEVTSTSYAPTSQVHMYNSLLPIVMIVFSAIINHEYPTGKQLLFVLVTVAGVFIARMADNEKSGMTAIGMVLITACILVVSVNRALVRRATGYFGSFEIVYLTTLMGAVMFSVVSFGGHLASGQSAASYFVPLQTPAFLASIFYLGIGAACIAFLLMTYASANLPYAVYSSTCTISTVVGIIAGVVIFHENFQLQEVIGTAVILAGVIGVSFSYDKDDTSGNRYTPHKKYPK